MVWLLAAESRKLLRPLVWGAVLATVAFLVLLTWAATNNARSGLASPRVPDVCVGSTTPAPVVTWPPPPPSMRTTSNVVVSPASSTT